MGIKKEKPKFTCAGVLIHSDYAVWFARAKEIQQGTNIEQYKEDFKKVVPAKMADAVDALTVEEFFVNVMRYAGARSGCGYPMDTLLSEAIESIPEGENKTSATCPKCGNVIMCGI